MRSCEPKPEFKGGDPIVITKIDTVWTEKTIIKRVYTPGETVTIPGPPTYKDIDTTAILQDFFAKRIYEDTIKFDTLGYVLVKDTISQNKIISRETSGKYYYPVVNKETTTIIPPKSVNQLYVGFNIQGSKQEPINYFGPDFTLKTKKDRIYELGIGYDPYRNQGVGKFGTKWKIKIK